MTTFKVAIVQIESIVPHTNADKLEIANIAGWQCVVGKNQYRAGDHAVYIPIDSVLPSEVEEKLFGKDSKIKLSKGRVKTIKIRGAISQGMLADPKVLFGDDQFAVGDDVTSVLKITKYEPPAPPANMRGGNPTSKRDSNPHFHKYGGLENFKNYNKLFKPGEDVIITEKIHGTNFRCGWVPTAKDTLWKKLKSLVGLLPKYEFVFGSNNVQLQNQMLYAGYYEKNVYAEAVKNYRLKELLQPYPGLILYGEIYGDGIQKGYHYGCKAGEQKFVAFDLRDATTGEFADYDEFVEALDILGLPTVPVLYKGPFDMDAVKALTKGNSIMAPTQKVLEGVVIKAPKEEKTMIGRKCLKLISDEYLLGDQTDFH